MLNHRDLYDETPARVWLPWGALAPLLAFVFVLSTQFAGIALIEPIVPLDARGNPVDAIGLLAFTLVPFCLLGLLVPAWTRFVEGRPLASIG